MRIGRQTCGILLATSAVWWAQAQTQPSLTFEVASIRPSTPEERPNFAIDPGGTTRITAWTPKQIIQNVYDIPGFFVFGAPNWSSLDTYDIVAKAQDSAGESAAAPPGSDRNRAYQSRMMLRFRALLAERFQLQTHMETREVSGYALVVSKGGPKLHESNPAEPGLDVFKAPDGGKGQGIRAGRSQFRGGTKFTGQRANMSLMANMITRGLGIPVIDKSGLTNEYDFVLEWVPQEVADGPDGAGPTIFTALQEQLGLKLESAKVPAEVLVIDRLEKPSEN
ncbi:MAG TPA: TIGR03435 family protein [Bryobacteraceae bacterium]|jgi:uncharacterized protein (TIGR03435 family)